MTRRAVSQRNSITRHSIASFGSRQKRQGGATMTRTALMTIGAASLAVALAMPAQAQQVPPAPQAQQRPQIETKKVDGTDNVYIFRNGNHQSMFVVTTAGVIATDPVAHGRPTGGQQYVDEIK